MASATPYDGLGRREEAYAAAEPGSEQPQEPGSPFVRVDDRACRGRQCALSDYRCPGAAAVRGFTRVCGECSGPRNRIAFAVLSLRRSVGCRAVISGFSLLGVGVGAGSGGGLG